VTGFKYKSGFGDPPAKATAQEVKDHLDATKNVGCETCHGPGSMHADHPKNKDYQALMNSLKIGKTARELQKVDTFCQKCHDIENDVNWGNGRFAKAWKEIAHSGLSNRRPAINPGAGRLVPSGGIDAPAAKAKD
jgi:hypothetical protein